MAKPKIRSKEDPNKYRDISHKQKKLETEQRKYKGMYGVEHPDADEHEDYLYELIEETLASSNWYQRFKQS
jgi:hypothetical protein